MPNKESSIADLAAEHQLSQAEAEYVHRATDGGKTNVDETVAFIKGERVGPSALNEQTTTPRAEPRMAPHARLDAIDEKIAVMQRELADLRAARELAGAEAFRVAGQGTAPPVAEDELAAVVVPADQADKIEEKAEKQAAADEKKSR